MRLLLSAHACAPHQGSEPGVGWNWAREACRLGHEVVVLTSPAYRLDIERELPADPLASRILFIYPNSSLWPAVTGQLPRALRLHNAAWQLAAYHAARELARQRPFDMVHHITWGGIRDPSFLGHLDAPFVFGPVGGGETAPRDLRDDYSLRGVVLDAVRDLANASIQFNPVSRTLFERAVLIAVRTTETLRLVPARHRAKTIVYGEIGIHPGEMAPAPRRARQSGGPHLLFVGRLLHWKGAHLALRSLQHVVARMPSATLTIVGRGGEEQRLRRQAARAALGHAVSFVPWIDRRKLFDLYRSHDLFVFPSLHDSGGTVVLEALGQGLPVICLDLGGPKQFVTNGCGRIVSTAGIDSPGAAERIAEAVLEICQWPSLFETLSAGALARAREFAWQDRVGAFYDTAFRRMTGPRCQDVNDLVVAG